MLRQLEPQRIDVRAPLRHEPERELDELGGRARRGPRPRETGRGGELPGDVEIGPSGREREMANALLGILDPRRELAVRPAPPSRRGGFVDRGREQGMLVANTPSGLDSYDARLLRGRESRFVDDADGRRLQTGREQQCVAGLGGKPPQPRSYQSAKLVRDGQPLRSGRPAQTVELPSDLDGVEGIPSGRRHDLHEGRTRRDASHLRLHDRVKRREAHRPEAHFDPAVGRDGVGEDSRTKIVHPHRRQHADRRILEAPQCVLEHRARQRVEPLGIVDRQQHRRRAGEVAQKRERGSRDSALVGRRFAGGATQQGYLDREALDFREPLESFLLEGREEVGQTEVGEARLGAARTRREDDASPCLCECEAMAPDRGLSDPRDAADDERS